MESNKTKEELEELCEKLQVKLRSVKEMLKIVLQSINEGFNNAKL